MVVLLLWHSGSYAQSNDQLSAIRALGTLNGVALQCNALSETQRMKRALVANLPKRRQLGELFDYETNKSFMAFIENSAECPSPQSLKQQVDEALNRLEALYGTK
ncbi:MAG: hypothetical protein KZQ93_21195 [Candidatus Thiodiazotropha sp. (ex Monitilora ramsayi)]|nr:hypothetical protein [Candidatus Thiodiazotropha sp. (ex Monitilora ramsayi)]